MKTLFIRLWLLATAAALTTSAVCAQTGSVQGHVLEGTAGTAIPGVNVLIQGTALGGSTDTAGYYSILNVPAGTYTITAATIPTATAHYVVVTAGHTTLQDLISGPFLVTLTADADSGSLRQAIIDASGTGGTSYIFFSIPGSGTQSIHLSSQLPSIQKPMVIDGSTQPGFSGTPLIEIDGTNAGPTSSGFVIDTSYCVIRGLVINRFQRYGILVAGGTQNRIEGNWIGVDATGMIASGNLWAGVRMEGHFNTIGGAAISQRNVVSGNTNGIVLYGDMNGVMGNFIGTDPSGHRAIPNTTDGIDLFSSAPPPFEAGHNVGGESPDSGNVISGNGFRGIYVYSADNRIQGNFIGTDVSGTAALGNGTGVSVSFCLGNTIGGLTNSRNVISGNRGDGIYIEDIHAIRTKVQGNYIGVDATGRSKLGNGSNGIFLNYNMGTMIGDTTSAGRNIISGNALAGIAIATDSARLNTVIGNFIGTDVTGTTAIGNGRGGVSIVNGLYNTIGGGTPVAGNLISGNTGDGVSVSGSTAARNVIAGNKIGTDVSGTAPMGNSGHGVLIEDTTLVGPNLTMIGGRNASDGNVIANNGGDGVRASGGVRSAILSNSIYANHLLGIDLGFNGTSQVGVTPNDPLDADYGPNGLQNFPVIESATPGTASVGGSFAGSPNGIFQIQFFLNASADPSGYGQGQQYLGSTSLMTDAAGNGTFSGSLPITLSLGNVLTTTATDTEGNTSEFSRAYTVSAAGPVTPSVGFVLEDYGIHFSSPGRLAVDHSDSVIVHEAGKGQILNHVSPFSWGWLMRLDHIWSPGDFVYDRTMDMMYVSDTTRGVFAFGLSGADSLHLENLTPLLSGLGGPSALELVSIDSAHRWLYISLVYGPPGPRVVRANVALAHPSLEDVITYPAGYPYTPQRMAIAPDGTLYLAITGLGQVRSLNLRSAPMPADGTKLPVVIDGLSNPHGVAIGIDGKIYVAASDRVVSSLPNSQTWTTFLSGLSGGSSNDIVWSSQGALYVSDAAAGRILRVKAPRGQALSGSSLRYVISQDGDPRITDGSDIAAIRNGFAHWQSVPTTSLTFVYGGLTAQKIAAAGDSVNLVTFQDDQFPFPPYVLAVTAKTLIATAGGDSSVIVDADIIFNPAYGNTTANSFGTDTKYGLYDIESIVTHESGHAAGLVHSGYPGATMFFVLQPGTGARTLKHDDQAWVSYLYPRPSYNTTYGSIGGKVADGYHPGSGVAGALVLTTSTTTSDTVHAYTDQYGNYKVPGLAPGNYRVYIHPLDGDVFGYPLTAGYVSANLQMLTSITDFPAEFYNGTNESSDPGIDNPSQWTAVSVTAGTTTPSINLVTNLDNIPPTVVSVFPKAGSTNADVSGEIIVTFSEAIDRNTITDSTTFSLMAQGAGAPVKGSFIYLSGNTVAVYTPSAPLAYNKVYTIQVRPGITDLKGNSLVTAFTGSFTTIPPDTAHPTVEQIVPANATAGVFITSSVTVVFSEPVQQSTVTGAGFVMTRQGGTGVVTGSFTFDQGSKVATFKPVTSLAENAPYVITLSTGIKDLAGNSLAAGVTSTFTTVPKADPQWVDYGPSGNETGVTVKTPVFIDFSKPVNSATVNAATFQLTGPAGQVTGSFDSLVSGSRIVFRPAADLQYSSNYTITLTTGVQDLSTPPRYLTAPLTSSFTTAAKPALPEIFNISPPAAVTGADVTINGQGFDPDPVRNAVVFDTVTATVTGSSLNSLTMSVPLGAGSGAVTVTVGGVKSAPFQFVVLDANSNPSNQVVATVNTSNGTRNGAVTPDGTYAYVTNSGTNSVSVINLTTDAVAGPAISVGNMPVKIAINPAGTYAYVTNYNSNTVSVIDVKPGSPTQNTVVLTIPVGINPIGVIVTPDGSRVYVAELTSKSISVIDGDPSSGAFNRVVAKVSTSSGNRDAAVNPDGTLAFFTGTEGLTILDISPTSSSYNQVVAKVNPTTGTRNVSVTPDGTLALVTTMDGTIWIVDVNMQGPSFGNVTAKVPTSSGSRDVQISPDGTLAYVTGYDGNIVLVYRFVHTIGPGSPDYNPVVSTSITLNLVDTIAVGKNPEGLVFSPRGNLLLVANTGSGNVTLINLRKVQYDFVILATNSVKLDALAVVRSGNVVVNDVGTAPGLVSGVELSLGALSSTPAGYTLKANRIQVMPLATVSGAVQYNQLDNKGTIKGTRTTPLPLPVYTSLPLFATGPVGTADVTVLSFKTTTLAAGKYRDISVSAGGKLVLSGGTYNVRNISLGATASLFFRASCDVRVQGRFGTGAMSYVGPAADLPRGSTIGASSAIFYIAGINGKTGKVLEQPGAAGIGAANTLRANFYAPNGTIWFGAQTQATGAFAAKDVLVGGSCVVTYDSYFLKSGSSAAKAEPEEVVQAEVPEAYYLWQNYPNPFNPSTTIQVDIPKSAVSGVHVTLVIYNVLGQVVHELVSDQMNPGRYSVVWEGTGRNGERVASGVYLYRLTAGSFVQTRKMLLLR